MFAAQGRVQGCSAHVPECMHLLYQLRILGPLHLTVQRHLVQTHVYTYACVYFGVGGEGGQGQHAAGRGQNTQAADAVSNNTQPAHQELPRPNQPPKMRVSCASLVRFISQHSDTWCRPRAACSGAYRRMRGVDSMQVWPPTVHNPPCRLLHWRLCRQLSLSQPTADTGTCYCS
jgi:hypothetical protein